MKEKQNCWENKDCLFCALCPKFLLYSSNNRNKKDKISRKEILNNDEQTKCRYFNIICYDDFECSSCMIYCEYNNGVKK